MPKQVLLLPQHHQEHQLAKYQQTNSGIMQLLLVLLQLLVLWDGISNLVERSKRKSRTDANVLCCEERRHYLLVATTELGIMVAASNK